MLKFLWVKNPILVEQRLEQFYVFILAPNLDPVSMAEGICLILFVTYQLVIHPFDTFMFFAKSAVVFHCESS
jgi:hypothetical protein